MERCCVAWFVCVIDFWCSDRFDNTELARSEVAVVSCGNTWVWFLGIAILDDWQVTMTDNTTYSWPVEELGVPKRCDSCRWWNDPMNNTGLCQMLSFHDSLNLLCKNTYGPKVQTRHDFCCKYYERRET